VFLWDEVHESEEAAGQCGLTTKDEGEDRADHKANCPSVTEWSVMSVRPAPNRKTTQKHTGEYKHRAGNQEPLKIFMALEPIHGARARVKTAFDGQPFGRDRHDQSLITENDGCTAIQERVVVERYITNLKRARQQNHQPDDPDA